MNKIRLSHYPHAIALRAGVKTEVNGVELQDVVEVTLHCPVDSCPQLFVTQNAFDGLDVTLEGDVYPRVNLFEGYELVVERGEYTTRYYTRRRPK